MATSLQRHSEGLSLIDLLVGLAVGMVATLVILSTMIMFDARRRSTIGHSDAQINLGFAGGWLAKELRIAGHGLSPSSALGCMTHRAAAGTPDSSFLLVPVSITQGPSGAPDTLTVLAAGDQALPPARLIAPYTMGGNQLTLDSTLGIANGHQLLLYAAGQADCALLAVTSVSIGAFSVQPNTVANMLSGRIFVPDSTVVNLGRLRYRRYAVDTQYRLQMDSFDPALGTWVTSPQADGIVNLQLQYGFDTRAGTQVSPQVTFWSDALVDADADGQLGDNGDWQRMLAIRFALVARSVQRREESCDAPTPTWLAGDTTGALVVTDIVLTHIPDWRCWRYRVFQTEVLLRNQLWAE